MKKSLVYFLIVCLSLALLVWAAHQVTWCEFIKPVRHGFYSACMAAIVFYLACLLRSLARYFNAKTKRINQGNK